MLLRRVFGREVARGPAETQDDDPVGDLEDIGEVVADHDDPEAALAQATNQLQHLFGLRHAQRRGRLVQEDDTRLPEQRASYGHLLTLTAGEGPDLGAQAGDRHRQAGEQLSRSVLHLRLVELARSLSEARRDLLMAEEDVGDDVEVVAEGEVLVDRRDAELGGVLRPGDLDLATVEADPAFVGAVDARDRLHQRRLAGAVVAHEADHLAAVNREVDPVQGLDRAESLAHALQL